MTDLDGVAMTNSQLATLKVIAQAMGLELDELGHPFRRVPRLDVDGERYLGVTDFDPLNDPADAFRVQVHFGLTLYIDAGCAVVRNGFGPLLAIHELPQGSEEDRVIACCHAVCKAAAIFTRREQREIDGAGQRG